MSIKIVPYVRLLFAAFSVAILFYFVPFRDTIAALRQVDPFWFAIAFLTQFAVRAAGTIRMQVIAANQGMNLSLSRLHSSAAVPLGSSTGNTAPAPMPQQRRSS